MSDPFVGLDPKHTIHYCEIPMKEITIVIPGVPAPWTRAGRDSRSRGKGHSFMTPKSEDYKHLIQQYARMAMGPEAPLEGAVEVYMLFTLPIPPSWSGRKKDRALSGFIHPISRPDIDNFAKAIMDGLNGLVYKDDSQIVKLTTRKQYGSSPCARVVLMNGESAFGRPS